MAAEPSGFSPEVLAALLREQLPAFPAVRLCVAFSGGVDSMALLHAARRLADLEPAVVLRALHVDHGLQPASASWAAVCADFCRHHGIPMETLRLALPATPGASVEAVARDARYAALAGRLAPGEALLTAHHRDDQLETLLLQLVRGAGVAGLAAMPRAAPLGPGLHLRPLLDVDRSSLIDYARANGLHWVDDPMNVDGRFDRAWLRSEVLPAMRERWPGLARTVARSAAHLGEARELLGQLAALDSVSRLDGSRLSVDGLASLPRVRQVNLLRWWIAGQGLGMPSAARLGAILDDVLGARDEALPLVSWAKGEVRRYRGWLYAMPPLAAPSLAPGEARGAEDPLVLGPGQGQISLVSAVGEGLATRRLQERLTWRSRTGGERLKPAAGARSRTLKNLFQENGIVPWMRPRIPVLWHGQEPVAVGDLWIDARFAAEAGETALRPRWEQRPALW